MWIYVLLGNVLRGIGETPVQPLGISYIDDFATEENAALYVGKKSSPIVVHDVKIPAAIQKTICLIQPGTVIQNYYGRKKALQFSPYIVMGIKT